MSKSPSAIFVAAISISETGSFMRRMMTNEKNTPMMIIAIMIAAIMKTAVL